MATDNPQILSMQLCTGLVSWLEQNTYFNGFFKSFNDYPRLEFLPNETPSISVYMGNHQGTNDNSWYEEGVVDLEVTFSLYESRKEFSKQVIVGLEMLRVQLLTNPIYIISYIAENYVPGLQHLNTNNSFPDLNKLKDKNINAKNGCISFIMSLKYSINILANQRALWNNKKDFYSPINDIYNVVDTNKIVINQTTL
jgi:hypothetical protein